MSEAAIPVKRKRGRPPKVRPEPDFGLLFHGTVTHPRRWNARINMVVSLDEAPKLPRDYTIFGLSQEAIPLSRDLVKQLGLQPGHRVEVRIKNLGFPASAAEKEAISEG